MNNFFSRIIPFIFFLNHGGSLLSPVNILCGTKLLRILRIVLLKMLTFSFEKSLEKARAQLNSLIAFRLSLL